MRIDLSKWGPLTWLIVVTVVLIEVTIAAYLIIAQPSTNQVEHFIGVAAAALASPAVLSVAHAILRGQELRADASSGAADPVAAAEKPTVSTERELEAVVRPDAATTPDPVEGTDTDPNARLTP